MPAWGSRTIETEISPLILGEALIRLLSLYGGPGTVLVLEDIHWADPETLAIVQYLADNLAGKQVLCVATLRDSEPSAGLDTVRSIHARRAAPVIEVPRLSGHDVARLAACCLDTESTRCPRPWCAGCSPTVTGCRSPWRRSWRRLSRPASSARAGRMARR